MLVPLVVLLMCHYITAYNGEQLQKYNLEEAESYFSWFMTTYNKHYANSEKQMRFQIFKNNLKTINARNSASKAAVYGITKFSDETPEETHRLHTGYIMNNNKDDDLCKINSTVEGTPPDSFDWRTKNVVTPVKNQQMCGSCWAFGVTGNIEGQYAIKNQKLISLSEQQLVDCDKRDQGCGGGNPESAFRSLIEEGGQETEDSYSYTGEDGTCAFDSSKVVVKLADCVDFDINKNEEKLKAVLYNTGPLTIAIDATALGHYKSGIMLDCDFYGLDHAVLLVGYGEENGIPFWIIKNSWGADWGEKGYFRVKRGMNSCGMMEYYPSSAVL